MTVRTLVIGNAGSGKTTFARRLAAERVPVLSLDAVAFDGGTERRPIAESVRMIDSFLSAHDEWVIEGCYADLGATILPRCAELIFLNPGVDACVSNCLGRPWEPDKFATEEDQRTMLKTLVPWVRSYAERDDEYGLMQHRSLFDEFDGPKREFTTLAAYG